MDNHIITTLAISFGLGLLVGLQREHAGSRFAGIRTFPLITLQGTVSGLLVPYAGGWVVGAGLAGIALLLAAINTSVRKLEVRHIGQTTEVAALLMYGTGAYLALGNQAAAIALGGAVAVLLQLKRVLHRAVERVGERDIMAIMQFVVISLIVLPVLPDAHFGPFGVWNPRNIWLMVVLIVGISIIGYFAYKILGHRKGTLLGGVLGGIISSTATTVTYARRTKDAPQTSRLAALVIMIASAIAFLRVIIEVAVVTPAHFPAMAPPLAAAFVLMTAIAGALYLLRRQRGEPVPEQQNPAQLKTALVFAALYALILLAVEAAKAYFGREGLYVVAVVAGLTDVDAITLSTAKLVQARKLEAALGWKLILIASLANLGFKAGLVALLGSRQLLLYVALLFGLAIAGGLAVFWLWPDTLSLDLHQWLPAAKPAPAE